MDFCFATLAALFMLVAAASSAPAGAQDACVDVRSSSLELNQYAKTASGQAQNQSKDLAGFISSLAWMEAKDMCDPGSLKQKSTPCVEKIFRVLTSYNSALVRISGFQSCSELAKKVKPAVEKLHEDMRKCVKSLGGLKHEEESHSSTEDAQPIEGWLEPSLCRYTLDRLFSFSIVTARVFAVGDPAHHSEGSAEKCM